MKTGRDESSSGGRTDLFDERRRHIREVYGSIAGIRENWIKKHSYFYRTVGSFLSFIVEPGRSVLLLRSELGQFLEILRPSRATGADVSPELVALAATKNPQYTFICAEPETIELNETFDYVLFYTVGDIIDIEKAFRNAGRFLTDDGRMIVINYNYLWRPLMVLAERLKLKIPQPVQHWLNVPSVANLLHLSGFEVIKKYEHVLLPVNIPLVSRLFNRVFARMPLIRHLNFIQVIVAKKLQCAPVLNDRSVSVIVPCKNELENIEPAVRRIPEMGSGTEIIFCDDKSTDGTPEEIERVINAYPERNIRLVHGPGICKAMNVWTGFDAAKGDILMILDADLTVIPEELPYFYDAIAGGRGEFINGTRMIYSMEQEAMRTLNIIGNKFFSILFTYILGQRITDTLCGTKVIWRKDWPRIRTLLGSWGISDRWGDYELLFGAAKLHLKIVEVPVHYMERVYGETKMKKRLLNGLIMLRMCMAAFRKFRF